MSVEAIVWLLASQLLAYNSPEFSPCLSLESHIRHEARISIHTHNNAGRAHTLTNGMLFLSFSSFSLGLSQVSCIYWAYWASFVFRECHSKWFSSYIRRPETGESELCCKRIVNHICSRFSMQGYIVSIVNEMVSTHFGEPSSTSSFYFEYFFGVVSFCHRFCGNNGWIQNLSFVMLRLC